MQLEWMGDYREIVEKLIHYCNVYAAVYKKERLTHEGVTFSYSQVQVLEYLLENESNHDNMSIVAARLGIALSTFSKLVTALEAKGLLEKYFLEGNRKNIVVRVSDLGRSVYASYSKEISNTHFTHMFEALDNIPREYLPYIAQALAHPMGQKNRAKQKKNQPALIPCHKNHD
ncbi:MAG: winged helix-turn-helix transcriptional regulator [Clostridia bacterium]|nr:winged helix-turn-helix transcriptional regulator [Clostridia bacterium]